MRMDAWLPEHTQLARELFARRASEAEFRETLGRSKQAAREHVKWKDDPEYRAKRNISRASGKAPSKNRRRSFGQIHVDRPTTPERLRQEANERASAPQTLTGFVFGDPPIGYRAIDRKREQETA
jgi:hypothetical protein